MAAYSGQRTSPLLANALWTTQGELTRGYTGIGQIEDTLTALAPDAALERWSRDVRSALLVRAGRRFEFDNSNADSATLKSGTTEIATLDRPNYDKTKAELIKALQVVLKKAALRADRMSEMLTQVAVPYSFFAMVLNLQPGRHRFTYELMRAALNLSGIAVMQFKHHFKCAVPPIAHRWSSPYSSLRVTGVFRPGTRRSAIFWRTS